MKHYTSKYLALLTVLAISVFGSVLASDTNGSYPPARRLLPAAWKASWSPDSKRLAFTRHTGKQIEGKEGISVLELESGIVTNLTAEGKDPAWSPDGKFIAFVAHPDAGEEVWVIPAAGGEPVKIRQGQWPAWTPDSKRVIVPTYSRRAVLSVAVDVPQEEPMIFFTNAISGYPGISPDASRIAFGSGGLQIFDTKTEQLVAKLPSPAFFTGWSPDGQQVVFADVSGARSGLWIFDVRRGGAYQVATNGTRPAWSPDGKRLVYDVWSGRYADTNWTKELWMIETATLPRNPVLTNQLSSALSAESLVGKSAPAFKLPLLDGGDFDLASHKDKHIVLLDFWATWCGPCKAVMPTLAEISREYADKGVKYFAVNLREDSAKIRGYLEAAKLDIAVPLDKDGSIARKYGVSGIPAMVIVGKDGQVKKVHVGSSPNLKQELTRSLDDLLAKP